MKQKIYILGFATPLIISLGAIFKINHWPLAGAMLILGILTLVFLFLPLALRNSYKAESDRQNLILYWTTWLTCFVVFIGMLFKILHWPMAGLALLIALPFPYVVFLPVYLVVTSKNKNFNIYNTVFVLFLLTAVSAVSLLLALSVSKERIADSLSIAGNYNRMENAIVLIPYENRQSDVDLKINDIIKISGEYKDLILKVDGITADQWNNDPQLLLASDSWQTKRNKLMELGLSLQGQLKTGLSDLLIMLEKTPGYESLAKSAPSILDMDKNRSGNSYNWKDDIMIYSEQPWSLLYLEGLEANLKLLRLSINN